MLANDSNAGKSLAAIAFHDIKADSATDLVRLDAKSLGASLKTEWRALVKASGGPNDTFKQLVGMAVDTRNALVDGINDVRPGRVSPSAPAAPAAPSVAKLTGDGILDVIVGKGGGRPEDLRRTLGGFEFGAKTRNNGGNNLISRPIVVTVKDGTRTEEVAVHLNAVLTSSHETRVGGQSSITIKGSDFHLTARSKAAQNLIDKYGPSSMTADNSVHVGPSNAKSGWNNRPDQFRNLARELNVSESSLVEALERRFPPGELVDTVHRFQDDVKHAVVHGSGAEDVWVHFEGDKSFPVRGDGGGVSARAISVPAGLSGDVVHGV
ncbi:hypothetical protein PV417_32685, partial [Streptomyces sp. ME19-03-3]|nr:hypothetical protein [Streptomyces sp. ME19-03-3]